MRPAEANTVKRVLYCGPDFEAFDALVRGMAPGSVSVHTEGLELRHPRAHLRFSPAFTAEAAWAVLDANYVNLLFIDLRGPEDADHGLRVDRMRRLLRALDDVDNMESRYGFHRILVLVDDHGEHTDRLLVELGGHGIRHVLKRAPDAAPADFGAQVLARSLALMLDRAAPRTALCAAGGGITAIYFELGALKCLDDCLPPGALNHFDMYFGISAGAVVMSMIANGFSADEFMAALAGVEGGRIPPLNLSLLRLGHLNTPDMLRRLGYLTRKSLTSLGSALAGRTRPSLDAAFLELTALAGPPFRSDRFETILRDIMSQPGATNDFRRLPRPLFVGASNQDSRRHTLFGAESPGTPISRAVQASLSINPAFSAVEIDGAWYEDGAVTRTSNFTEAIKRDANLIFVLDPFVPYVSKSPGFANRRGVLFNVDQDIRSLSFTRYESARDWAMRRHPEVSAYTFLPNNRLRKVLSTNPMDHRPYLQIFRGAYLATLNRLRVIEHRLRGDLAAHGMALSLDRAAAIEGQLTFREPVRFEDFFVDRRVALRLPPLALEPPT